MRKVFYKKMRYILPEYSKGNPKETRPYFLTFVKK
jgi:hypothetical protein